MTGAKPRLLVLYDRGSCGPLEIRRSLSSLADLEFAIGRSEHARQAVPILEGVGTVRPIDDVLDDRAKVPAGGYEGVLTYSERMLGDCSVLVERWDLPGHSTEVVAGLTDKSVQRARLARAGLGDVRSVPARTADEFAAAFAQVGTPCVVKPRRGEGSRQTFRVLAPDDARRLTGELTTEAGGTAPEPYVVEEMLTGDEPGPFADYVSVETISRAGVHRTVGVTSKFPLAEPFRETGQLWPCHRPVSWQAEIERFVGDVLGALGVRWGVTHAELKLTASGPRVIEVNGRLGGDVADLCLRALDFDIIAEAGRVALDTGTGFAGPYRGSDVIFQFNNLAPASARRLVGVRGVRELRKVAGIARYATRIVPGTSMEDSVGTQELDTIYGVAGSPGHLAAVLAEALTVLTFEFADRDGARSVVPALSLPSAGFLGEWRA